MNALVTAPLPGTVPDPKYPDSDGRPMGDTDFHNLALTDLRQGLEDHFAGVPDVYVASNLILYYQEGDPTKRRDPDVLVAKKVGKHKRRSFRIWEEKVVPRVLWEVASRKTWRVDVGEKRLLYARIGIHEYFLFDPEGRYLRPPLQGFRLVHGKSVPMKPNADGSLTSKELGLRFRADGERLRLFDVKTGLEILTRTEQAEVERARAQAEKERAQTEREQAEVERARAQAERERAQTERERAQAEKERAQAEKLRAEKEKERSDLEKKRADELQSEVDRLRRRLNGRGLP
jgi:Uma2 family endonuclease